MRWIDVFNRGFRTGANARASSGIAPGQAPAPSPPPRFSDENKRVYALGYRAGYQMGASDGELSAVENPGTRGMVRALSEKIARSYMG